MAAQNRQQPLILSPYLSLSSSRTMLCGRRQLGALRRRMTGAALGAVLHHAPAGPSAFSWAPQQQTRTLYTPTTALFARRIRAGARRQQAREPTPGDWLCQCGETNYRSKRECYKCGAPAPPLPPGVRRLTLPGEDPHDWACPCGQMNFRGSVLCHKCQQPKPEPPPLPGKELTLWTCPKCKGVNRSTRKFCFRCSLPSPLIEFKPQQ